MNVQQEAVALFKFLEGRGFKPSVRSISRALRDQGLSFTEVALRGFLQPFVASTSHADAKPTQESSTNDATPTQADATPTQLRAHDKVSLSTKLPLVDLGDTPTLTLLPEPVPAKKPAKRGGAVLSAYAGTTLDSFGDLEPLVREVLAADGFGSETKAFSRALESLAMWRVLYGEAALARGLEVAADKRFGHRYVGGVAKRFDPDAETGFSRREDEPNASDLLPTNVELIAAGIVEAVDSAAVIASRPAWLNARIAAQMAEA